MQLRKLYVFRTRAGPAFIARSPDGRFHAVFEDEPLGSYETAQKAVDDLAGGVTFTPPSGIDTSALGIPFDLGEWEKLPTR